MAKRERGSGIDLPASPRTKRRRDVSESFGSVALGPHEEDKRHVTLDKKGVKKRAWTRAEDQVIINQFLNAIDYKAIQDATGRASSSIRVRVKLLLKASLRAQHGEEDPNDEEQKLTLADVKDNIKSE
ncbi:hypothetical protein BCV70DRAFT_216830 [Testicularia cyperi]|uniref:Myb-like domain-containing protein n=1 Tax=Testicularia cyperi TaxID=1882483 RepID=A0A317XQN0_9BASI|nr:hypothetical protein BCV70DRAFT_216830 [Testicularia cyperi]